MLFLNTDMCSMICKRHAIKNNITSLPTLYKYYIFTDTLFQRELIFITENKEVGLKKDDSLFIPG